MRRLINATTASILIGSVFLLGLAGCSRSRVALDTDATLPAAFPNHSLDQIHRQLISAPTALEAYRAESALSVRTPEQSGSFSASIKHKRNDSLLISISPGLGIIAVRTLVTRDSFFVHDRINKELTVGRLESLQRILPLPVTSEALYTSLLGLLAPDPSEAWELMSDVRYYTIKAARDGTSEGTKTFTVDPIYWRVVRYEERDPQGSLIEERTFSDFQDVEGIYLPRRLTFRRPPDKTAATLYYRELQLNPSPLSFTFDVSPTVDRIVVP